MIASLMPASFAYSFGFGAAFSATIVSTAGAVADDVRWFDARFCEDVSAGGRVGFTRLVHASANEALEIFLAWHRHCLLWVHHGSLPSSAPW
jgi:hypothetical protein